MVGGGAAAGEVDGGRGGGGRRRSFRVPGYLGSGSSMAAGVRRGGAPGAAPELGEAADGGGAATNPFCDAFVAPRICGE